jgi:hypothetical protein
MKFNLASLNNETKTITNADEAFIGTALAEQPFRVEVSRMSRANKIDTMSKAVLPDGTISNGEYSKALFIASVSDVNGFEDENGTPLGLEDDVVSLIWEYSPDALVEEIKAAIQNFNAIEEKKVETQEQGSVVLPLGQ